MIKRRGKLDCADCHFGKQRRNTSRKALDRRMTRANDIIFGYIWNKQGITISAILVIVDGYLCHVKTLTLRAKTEDDVNEHMKFYIKWTE